MKLYWTMVALLVVWNPAVGLDDTAIGWSLLEKSSQYHGTQPLPDLELRIQEPRLDDPGRYSVVRFLKGGRSFSLDRNRGDHISTHIVDVDGNAITLLDGRTDIPADMQKKHRLGEERTRLYAFSYRFVYGLPASLDRSSVRKLKSVDQKATFEGKPAIALTINLQRPVFSTDWILFLDPDDHHMLGIEVLRGGQPDRAERIVFDQEMEIGGRRMPRIRHWYHSTPRQYLGSDIIVTAKNVEQ